MPIYSHSKFIKKYKKQMTKILMQTDPNLTISEINEVLDEMIEEQIGNPRVVLDNNYTGESKETTLLSVFDWAYDRKPIIAGNGTFYANQYEALNPIASMLKSFLAKRKEYKRQMFAIKDTKSDEYNMLDLTQGNEKTKANSYYGGAGSPSSAFYSKWSGPATTLSAQSVISTCESLFESFCADNYTFLDLDELLFWCEEVREQSEDKNIDNYVKFKTAIDVYNRLIDKLLQQNKYDGEILLEYLKGLSEHDLTFLYYKNNLIQFIYDHTYIKELFDLILSTIQNLQYVDKKDDKWLNKIPHEYYDEFLNKTADDWNNFVNYSYFMNPNKCPDNIKKIIIELDKQLVKYVYVQYMAFDRIYRLKNLKRNVVTVIDTDSNILALDTIINFLYKEIVTGNSYGRSKELNDFILVNTITYTLTNIVTDTLLAYGKHSNVPEKFRGDYRMKNEFYFSRLIIGLTKKRYISRIVLREGNMMNPPQIDIKGFDFKKATCSEYAEEVFMGIIENRIIDAEKISVSDIYNDVREFKNEVLNSLKNKERRFLPNGNVKDLSAYKDAGRLQSVRGYLTWNALYPDNQIETPAKVSILKMNLATEEDCLPLKDTYPEIYETIMDKIFNDQTGVFVTKTWVIDKPDFVNVKDKNWIDKIPKKYKAKFKKRTAEEWNAFVEDFDFDSCASGHWEIKSKGLQVIAIPSNSEIPEWCIPYIDYESVVNSIIAPFDPVLELFRVQFNEVGKTGKTSKSLTNIIKF